LLEEHLRRALVISRGDLSIFLSTGTSTVLTALAVGALILVALPAIRRRREEVFVEEEEV
jgi:MYXO-CTERM domain-containing protein